MTDILDGLISRVDCIGDDYTVRYYGNDGGLALGIIRISRKWKGGKVPQDIVVINSMDLNNLIGYIMSTHNVPTDMGDKIVHMIRTNSISLVTNYIIPDRV